MTTPYEDVITYVAAQEALITGIAAAYTTTPEALASLPAFVNIPLRGNTYSEAASQLHSNYTLLCVVYVARGDQQVAEGKARPLINLFEDMIWADPTLGATVDTVLDVRHSYGRIPFGTTEVFVGVRFEVDFKIRRAI